MNKAVYGGSFDPLTNGHMWVIQEGAKRYDQLVVVVTANPGKTPTFPLAERVEMIREAAADFPNVSVESLEGEYLVRHAKAISARHTLRGLRNPTDYSYEREIAHVNTDIEPDVETTYIQAPLNVEGISSSLVRGLVGPRGWEKVVKKYVPRPVHRKMLSKFELRRWERFWDSLGLAVDAKLVYDGVAAAYSEPQRFYHDLSHIAHCLDEFEKAREIAENPKAVEMAVWFHDFKYDPQAKDNEEASAKKARQVAKDIGMGDSFADRVAQLILETKHSQAPEISDAKILVDLDLSIFGMPWQEFDEYEANVRKEYAWVPEEVFRSKRAEILKGFLDRPQIFSTNFFRESYEARARENLGRSVARLVV